MQTLLVSNSRILRVNNAKGVLLLNELEHKGKFSNLH